MARRYRGDLHDGILDDFIEELDILSQHWGAGEFSYKAILEDEVDTICDLLDTFGKLYLRKYEQEVIEPDGFWNESDRESRLDELVSAVGQLRLFGGTGNIYLPTYTQPEKGFYQEMVIQIKQAINLLPKATMDNKAEAEIFDQLQVARQAAHFIAATLPRGGSRTGLLP